MEIASIIITKSIKQQIYIDSGAQITYYTLNA